MTARSRLFVALVSTVLIGYVAVGSLLTRVLGDSTYGQLAVFNEVVRIVIEAYVDPVNIDRTMSGARMGLVEALDGDSAYLEQDQFQQVQQPAREAGDVGLVLSRRFSFLYVVSVRPGGPAERAGVRLGDVLKTIDGRHTRPVPAPLGQRLLTGAPGSVLKLTVLRAGSEPMDLSIVRERLTPVPPRSRVLEQGPGYVRMTEFTPRSAEELKGELESLRRAGARSLVLDLRGVGQGAPADGIEVAGLFVRNGIVARVSGVKVPEQVFRAEAGRAAWELPVAVLVDGGTAGPAEIVAAALLEARQAPVVGEPTAGRAPLQRTVPLHEGGIVITVARYHSPNNTPIHGQGVKPSVVVEHPDEEDGEAPAGDPMLDKAIELLGAPAVKKAA